MKSGIYLLNVYDNCACSSYQYGYEYYDDNGSKLFEKVFKEAKEFDENDRAIVSDDGIKYYLINKEGKRVSEYYSRVRNMGDYYAVGNETTKFSGIIDANGKTILEYSYSDYYITQVNNKYYSVFETTEGKYMIYDLDKKLELAVLNSFPDFSEHYIESRKDGYYLYNGKMIYKY